MENRCEQLSQMVPVLEELGGAILKGWTQEPLVAELLQRWRLEPDRFIEQFGKGIYEHLMEVVKGFREPGDCPSLRALLDFLADRQVSVGDVFALCIRLRHQVGEAVYQRCYQDARISEYRAFTAALHTLFDANLRGVLDHYYSTLEQKDHQIKQMIAESENKDKLLHLQSREATMGEMIGAIAHQWKQPLNVLDLAAQELMMEAKEETPRAETVLECGDMIRKQVHYMSRTIDDFRRFLQPVDDSSCFRLREAVDDVMALVGRQYHSHGIDIHFSASSDPELKGLRNDFVQVLLILLANARDAILQRAQSGCVEITLQLVPEQAVITLEDTGGGIPEDLLPRIFEPYTTTKKSGTGIGLYIANRIVAKMGGTIVVANTPKGARLTLTLPCLGEACLR